MNFVASAREPSNPRTLIDCAYDRCDSHAVCRVRKPTGWANLCDFHYSNDNVRESIFYCQKHGLDTTEKRIAHCRALFKAPRDSRAWLKNAKSEIAKRYRDEVLKVAPVEREPGQDDEEIEI